MISTTEARRLISGTRDISEEDQQRLYEWYWAANYAPSPIVQDLRIQVSRRLDIEAEKERATRIQEVQK